MGSETEVIDSKIRPFIFKYLNNKKIDNLQKLNESLHQLISAHAQTRFRQLCLCPKERLKNREPFFETEMTLLPTRDGEMYSALNTKPCFFSSFSTNAMLGLCLDSRVCSNYG